MIRYWPSEYLLRWRYHYAREGTLNVSYFWPRNMLQSSSDTSTEITRVRKSNFEGSQSQFRNFFLVYTSAINCGSEVMQLRSKVSLKKLRTDEKSAFADMHVLVRYSFLKLRIWNCRLLEKLWLKHEQVGSSGATFLWKLLIFSCRKSFLQVCRIANADLE